MGDSPFSHQNWEPVTFHNPKKQKATDKANQFRDGSLVRKGKRGGAPEGQSELSSDDYAAPRKFDKVFGNQVAGARTQKNMNQDDLAKALNIQKSVVRDIEKGTAVYNPNLMVKIRKVLSL